MIFKLLGGVCGSLAAGVLVGLIVPIACNLPSDMSAADTSVGLVLSAPMLVMGFAVGYFAVARMHVLRGKR